MTWKSPGMTHLWCPKCQRQYGTDAELVLKDGKIVFKWTGRRSAHWSFVKGYTAHTSSYNNIRYDQVWLDK